MGGKTHAAAGALCAVTACVLLKQTDPFSLSLGLCAGAVGALAPDIDVDGSIGNKAAKKIIPTVVFVVLVAVLALFSKGQSIGVGFLRLLAVGILLVMTFLGLGSAHREKTHSVLFCVVSTLCVAALISDAAIFWLIGYMSHLMLDVLNTKGCSYLWPLKGKYCLGLCKASGVVNTAIFYASSALTIITLVFALV